MNLDTNSNFLCLICRQHGHETRACSQSPTEQSVRHPFMEAKILETLRELPSFCCKRCEEYQILKIADEADFVDLTQNFAHIDSINHTSDVMTCWTKQLQRHNLSLGRFSTIALHGSCPLCRLIFRVFPPQNEDSDGSASCYVRPFPSYDRQTSFLKETHQNLKSQYSISFCIESEEKALSNLMTNFADADRQMVGGVLEAFSLSSQTPAYTRKALSARRCGQITDFSLLRRWFQRCLMSHGVSCHGNWSDELLTTKMIDVSARCIVPCPPHCKYIALSYVWGSVVPEKNALENWRLPQTIEDAITVTQEMGIPYLWVRFI
jgi:hypothetical protein